MIPSLESLIKSILWEQQSNAFWRSQKTPIVIFLSLASVANLLRKWIIGWIVEFSFETHIDVYTKVYIHQEKKLVCLQQPSLQFLLYSHSGIKTDLSTYPSIYLI